jgi:hypothetical protein
LRPHRSRSRRPESYVTPTVPTRFIPDTQALSRDRACSCRSRLRRFGGCLHTLRPQAASRQCMGSPQRMASARCRSCRPSAAHDRTARLFRSPVSNRVVPGLARSRCGTVPGDPPGDRSARARHHARRRCEQAPRSHGFCEVEGSGKRTALRVFEKQGCS